MFSSQQPKPQFHVYPLRTSQLSKLNVEMQQINQEIYQNRSQIEAIRKKFQNEQYQNAYLARLQEKNRILGLKKQELDHINRLHDYHQLSENKQKQLNSKMYNGLANQYKLQIEENLRKKSVEKWEEKMRDREIIDKRIDEIRRKEEDKWKKMNGMDKRIEQENKIKQTQVRKDRSTQRQQQKHEFNERLSKTSQIPNEKLQAFDRFYDQISSSQRAKQKIYIQTAEKDNLARLNQRQNIQAKNQSEYLENLNKRAYQDLLNKKLSKEEMKRYWEGQMEANKIRKEAQKEKKLREDNERILGQIDHQRYEKDMREKERQVQQLYSSALSKQYFQQLSAQRQNSQRSRQHTYLNASSDLIASRRQVNSPQSPKSGLMLGNQKHRSVLHNPLSNPIPFTIGMTNPYILKEFQTKRRENSFVGYGNDMKSNLAQQGERTMRMNGQMN